VALTKLASGIVRSWSLNSVSMVRSFFFFLADCDKAHLSCAYAGHLRRKCSTSSLPSPQAGQCDLSTIWVVYASVTVLSPWDLDLDLILVLAVSTSRSQIFSQLPHGLGYAPSTQSSSKISGMTQDNHPKVGVLCIDLRLSPSDNGVSPRWFTVTPKRNVAVLTVLYYIVGMPRNLPRST
jgi:hypothetical protein